VNNVTFTDHLFPHPPLINEPVKERKRRRKGRENESIYNGMPVYNLVDYTPILTAQEY